MRRSLTSLGVAGAVALALSGVASAAPTVSVKAEAVPIPGFPGTGNILGAGAAVQSEITISGTEYGGYPPPLIGVSVYLPKGTKLHPQGFPTCPTNTIAVQHEPRKCPKASSAGPVGHANGFVVFGSERVPEQVSIEPFYAPGGGINFYVEGHTPASIEIASVGKFVNFNGGEGFGPKAVVEVPLVETVPGAPDASVERIVTKLGSAIKKGGKTIYYGTVPTSCPKGGFPFKVELTFAGLGGLQQQVVTVNSTAPCPKATSKTKKGKNKIKHGKRKTRHGKRK